MGEICNIIGKLDVTLNEVEFQFLSLLMVLFIKKETQSMSKCTHLVEVSEQQVFL